MGLKKVFSGVANLAVALQEKIEEKGFTTVLRNNNQANESLTKQSAKAVELFIQESDFGKVSPIIEEFRMSI